MIRQCVSTIRILTTIPVPGKDASVISSSLPFFPLAGIILSIITYAIYLFSSSFIHVPLLSGIILTGILFILTGGIHFDGLADTSDGFFSGKNRQRILEIFKDSRLGTYGVSALFFDIILKIILYSWYFDKKVISIVIISLVISRLFQAVALSFINAATPGSGIASAFCDKSRRISVVISAIVVIGAIYFYVNSPFTFTVIIVPAFFSGGLFIFYCIKKIGGITGDCTGALNEITELCVLLSGIYCLSI